MSFKTAPVTVISNVDKDSLLTPELRSGIDEILTKYPPEWKQSAIMPALTLVQEDNGGWVTTELMDQIAAYLDVPAVAVYEVATFYGMYDLQPQGRNKVCVCNSVSCMLNGSGDLIEHVEGKYGVKPGEVTKDGRFTFKEVECLGACKDAPAVLIGKTYHEKVSAEGLDDLIKGLK